MSKEEVSGGVFSYHYVALFFLTNIITLNLPVIQKNRQHSLVQIFLIHSLNFNSLNYFLIYFDRITKTNKRNEDSQSFPNLIYAVCL